MEADISGTQRKVVAHEVRPQRSTLGASGIPVTGGITMPFRVTRSWSAPAGHYLERFYLIDPNTREVLFEGPQHEVLIWGLQSLTEVADEIRAPLELPPGTYAVVFALGGVMGGEFEVEATEVGEEAA
jgi:hypothetical protein